MILATAALAASDAVATTAAAASRVPMTSFDGFGGAAIVSLIAFTIVFLVLAGLSAIICCVRYFAIIADSIGKKKPAAPAAKGKAPAAAPTASVAAPAPAVAVAAHGTDKKKLVAVISGAILAMTGKNVRVLSVNPAPLIEGNCTPMNRMWRSAGIAECLGSRLTRSWKD